ncbi:ubiquinone biosynthesis accessory factor UbiJ [Parachitinimonas caeni]|uniref:Ubiquinone biosynthesis accessory factor UbiJ n=1 Tax=Parachitinimonas caeni TaxID=3031301 RepID=A0ABT7DXU8_9NEIS|nr:hypothetical protein [Parachitinimonas caeni]MDK2124891.1 hypothetical protein [Parachitinimonas caeni]
MFRIAPLRHLLAQNAHLRADLARHAGKTACIVVLPFRVSFKIEADGQISDNASASPDATLTISPFLLPRLALKDPTARQAIGFAGDLPFATELGQVIASLEWDAEQDLSRVVGDVAAHRLAQTARDAVGDPGRLVRNLADSASEYWSEEARLLVRRPTAEQLFGGIESLRDDVARLEKRLEALESPEKTLEKNLDHADQHAG